MKVGMWVERVSGEEVIGLGLLILLYGWGAAFGREVLEAAVGASGMNTGLDMCVPIKGRRDDTGSAWVV